MRAAAAAMVLSFLALALAPQAAADDDSLKVVVVVEDKTYSAGTTGKVTVHVFDKGVHVDSDEAPFVQMGIFPIRTLNVTRKATGVYEGSFTLLSDDIYRGMAMITARAALGKANQSDTSYNEDSDIATLTLPQSASTGLQVDCHPFSVSGGALKPGAAVTIETVVTSNGTPVSPSYFSLVVTYYDRDHNDKEETLNATSASTGVYRVVYNLPDVSYDVDLTFEATAQYQSEGKDDSLTLSLDFFNLIYHYVSKTSTSTTFDLYIAGIDGKAVNGAVMTLSFWQDSNGSSIKSVGPLTTDSGGRVRPTIAFSEGAKVLHVEGTANASGRSQEFSGTIRLAAEQASVPKPSGDDFQVLFAGDEAYYTAGSTVNRDYYAFNDSKAWAGKPVYCHIVTRSFSLTPPSITPVSVEARTITTDAVGKFRLSVKPPAGKDRYIQVYFESATGTHAKPGGYVTDHDSLDGQYYSSDTDSFMASVTTPGQVVKVTVKELKVGAPSQVEASARGADPPLAVAAWGIGEVSNILDPSVNTGNWMIWNEIPSLLSRSGSKYTGTVTIPAFMPKDSKYTVMVMLESDDSIPAYGMASLRPGEGTDAGAFPWLYIIIILVVVVAIVVVVILLRRRPARVPPSDVVNFAGTPAVTQPPAVPPGGTVPPGDTAGPQGPGAPPAPLPPPPQQYQQPGPQQYPPPPQQYQQPAQQQVHPPPPQPGYVASPPPTGPLPPPSRQGKMAMPNNAMCAFCNQWLLQGTTGIMCHCGKCYHEHCARIQEKCLHCGTRLTL